MQVFSNRLSPGVHEKVGPGQDNWMSSPCGTGVEGELRVESSYLEKQVHQWLGLCRNARRWSAAAGGMNIDTGQMISESKQKWAACVGEAKNPLLSVT